MEEGLRKSYKYKLMPTPEQARQLERTLMLCRHVYNAALGERRAAWRMRGVSVSHYQQQAELPGIKADMPEYAEVNSQVLQDVVLRVERAFQAFFRRVKSGTKSGETAGYPRFQGRNRYHSFTYPQMGEHGCARLDNGFLVLSNIGRLAVRWSRPVEGTPKTVTISREADGWYAILSCADVPAQPLPPTGRETGIDVGLKVFLITADGEFVDNPRLHRRGEKQLKKAQQRVSRRKKGSNGRRKAVGCLQRAHQHVKRQRLDFHHKTALKLVRQYDTIFVEAIQPANLRRRSAPKPDGNGGFVPNGAKAKAGLNKSIHDAGWSQFLSILAYKAACAGKRVEAVNPAYTSQDCSECGTRVPKSLSVRTHVCPSCGLVLDRDENAARNIQWAGQALRGLAG